MIDSCAACRDLMMSIWMSANNWFTAGRPCFEACKRATQLLSQRQHRSKQRTMNSFRFLMSILDPPDAAYASVFF
jgi:hypothetical protein